MKKILFLLISIIGIVNAATSQITVSILPQKYFVEKITKDKFEINVMVQPGSSPHTYEPKTSQMKALAASKVYFSTGVSFEHVWLDKFKKNAKKTLFVDLSNGIEKLAMAEHEHHDEEEHEEHKDEHNKVLSELRFFIDKSHSIFGMNILKSYYIEKLPHWFDYHLASMDSDLAAHIKNYHVKNGKKQQEAN